MQIEIYDTDYTEFIRLLGTAHFTQRSVKEALQTVRSTGVKDLAVELDSRRFNLLNGLCIQCPRRDLCTSKCEFTAASEALGNIDANIWLIDMSEAEMRKRIAALRDGWNLARHPYPVNGMGDENLPWLWELGLEGEVIRKSSERLEDLRIVASPVWRVLIQERDALMAARLAETASSFLSRKERPDILALVGAAHVKGIMKLLRNPTSIRETLKGLNLNYSPPTLIRRVHVRS